MRSTATGSLPQPVTREIGSAVTVVAAGTRPGEVLAGSEQGGLWRLVAGAGVEPLPARHEHAVTTLAVDPASDRIASGDRCGQVLIHRSGSPRAELALGSRVRSLAWSPAGDRLALVSQTAGLVITDPEGRRIAGVAPTRRLRAAVWHRAGTDEHVVAVGAGGTTWIDPGRPDPAARRDRAEGAGLVVAIDAAGTAVAVGDLRGQVRILDTVTGHESEISGWPDPVDRLAWVARTGSLAVVGGDEVTLWDRALDHDQHAVATDPPRASIADRRISALASHPSRPVLAIGGSEGGLAVWDVALDQVRHAEPLPGPVTGLAWDPSGDVLVAGTRCGRLLEVEVRAHP
jgi:WD40 repeat protein